jgi:hypothetical protein
VFVPYFINVKGLSRSETFDKVKSWLDKCNQLLRLKFNARYKIDYELNRVADYWPISLWDLELQNTPLYTLTLSNTAGSPTTGHHVMGELYLDNQGVLYFCVADGTTANPAGTWKQVQLV